MIRKSIRVQYVFFLLIIPVLFSGLAQQAEASDPTGTSCIVLSKTGPESAVPGDTITYEFIVTNCGSLNFASGIAWVVDPLFGNNPLWQGNLYAGRQVMFTKNFIVTESICGELINTATAYGSVNGEDLTTYDVEDSDSWTVVVDCPVCGDGVLDAGEECDDGNLMDGDGCSANCTITPYCGDGVLDAGEECDDGNNVDGDDCSAVCTIEYGGEGCTPGYWKQYQHFVSWPGTYAPDTLFADVFEDAFSGMTLLEVLELGGGGLNALGRHVVAALLNAASTNVDYDRSEMQVINMFNNGNPGSKDEYENVKNILTFFNEQGCPLN